MKILYGVENNYLDITDKVKEICYNSDIQEFVIPKTDEERAYLFGDPIYGVVKHILIFHTIYDDISDMSNISNTNKKEIIQRYDNDASIRISY